MKLAAPEGIVIAVVDVPTNSLSFDIAKVNYGKVVAARKDGDGSISEKDNIYVVFGPEFCTIDQIDIPEKRIVSMRYSNVRAFLYEDEKDE